MPTGFPYKRILIVGATSGIGKGLAERFVQEGAKVIVSGRRKENLDAFVREHGSDKAAAVPFDISEEDRIPGFVRDVTTRFPDLDCVFLNSGVQRLFKFHKPSKVDLNTFKDELQVNYTSFVVLTHAFLPFLLEAGAAGRQVSILYTTSRLAICPMVRNPGYSGSKAALHSFILCLRAQLEDTGVKVLELLPPAVQTELHDAKHQPDLGIEGSSIGMPLKEFVDASWQSLASGEETNIIEPASGAMSVRPIEEERQKAFNQLWKAVKPADW